MGRMAFNAAFGALLAVLALAVPAASPRPLQVPERPDPRAHHQIVHHAAGQRVYLIGGSTRLGDGYHYFDDVWAWNGSGWERAGSLPFRRSSHRVVYHAQRRSILLFGGGFDGTHAADGRLWEWREGTWTPLGPGARQGRAEPGMCYDQRRDRVVVFGGWDGANAFSDTTWEWAGEVVTEATARGPAARAGHAFLYDPVRERCLMFGGRGASGLLADTWEWDGSEWHELSVDGPSERWFFGAATDPIGRRIVVFGGGGGDERDLGDTWTWDGERWTLLTGEGPDARGMAKLAFDGRHVVLFGGRLWTPDGFRDENDTWLLEDQRWRRRSSPLGTTSLQDFVPFPDPLVVGDIGGVAITCLPFQDDVVAG
jgi:hypothetical protein